MKNPGVRVSPTTDAAHTTQVVSTIVETMFLGGSSRCRRTNNSGGPGFADDHVANEARELPRLEQRPVTRPRRARPSMKDEFVSRSARTERVALDLLPSQLRKLGCVVAIVQVPLLGSHLNEGR